MNIKALEKLNVIAKDCSIDNWGGNLERAISPAIIGIVREFLNQANEKLNIYIFPIGNGEIKLELCGNDGLEYEIEAGFETEKVEFRGDTIYKKSPLFIITKYSRDIEDVNKILRDESNL